MKEKFLRRTVAALLALLTVFSCGAVFTACGGEKDPEAGRKDPEPPATDPTVTDTDTEDPVPPVEPTDPVDPTEPRPGEDEEPEIEMIKLKSPLKVFGGKRPYDIIAEDGVDRAMTEQFAVWAEEVNGAEVNYSYANAGSFREGNMKTPKIMIGNLSMKWTASARERMGDANWIVCVEDKHVVAVGTSADEVKKAVGCLRKALIYYTAHTESEETVLPNDFCVTSKEGDSQFDMYTLVTKKSEQYKFPRFIITSYGGYSSVDAAACETRKAGGFNSLMLSCGSVEANKEALKLMKEYGLYTDALIDNRLYDLPRRAGADTLTYEQIYDLVAAVEADYADCPNVLGYYLMDEPSSANFKVLGMLVKAIREICPDKEGYINLFPSYANSAQLGTTDYEEYVSRFMEEVNPQYVQCDNYPFQIFADTGERAVNAQSFISDLAVLRKWAGYFGVDTGLIRQILRWDESVDEVGPVQMLWQANLPLAFGFKRLSYWPNYTDTRYQELRISSNPNRMYDDSSFANNAVFKVGEELFPKKSVAVYSYFGHSLNWYEVSTYEVLYTADVGLGTISGAGNAVIGTFDDGSVYFVNRAAYEGNADTFLLGGYTADLDWFDPRAGVWKDAGECPAMAKTADGWSITLDPAEAVLFRAK